MYKMINTEVTQEQLDVIDKLLNTKKVGSTDYLSKSDIVELYVNRDLPRYEKGELLNNVSLDTLIKMLYTDDYFIKPTYKEDEWVHIGYFDGAEVLKIKEVINNNILTFYKKDAPNCIIAGDVRHATTYEIAQQKEKDFWRENDRLVWEIKEYDRVCDSSGECFTIDYIKNVMGDIKVAFKCGYHEFYDNLSGLYKVEYFAEDRKI